MGTTILIPEGIYDYEWLRLWQRIAQSSYDATMSYDLRPVSIVPTSDAAIVDTFREVAKFRADAIPIIDGDQAGSNYASQISKGEPAPNKIIRYGDDAAVEHLAAWILEPALKSPGDILGTILPDPTVRTLKNLQQRLVDRKKDRELRESLAWEALDSKECCSRACEFFHDLSKIAINEAPQNRGWKVTVGASGISTSTATHIMKASL
jgi:hypothetical protein